MAMLSYFYNRENDERKILLEYKRFIYLHSKFQKSEIKYKHGKS
jgi:hypothetical protein